MADEPPFDSYAAEVLSFMCPRCGAVSHNPYDRREGYCARCHDWTSSDDDDGSDRIVRIELLDDDENVIGVWDRNDERG